MREGAKKRISVRSYQNKPLSAEDVTFISERLDALNGSAGLCCKLCEDASAAFDNLKKSYGMFKNVKSVIVMQGKSDDPDLYEKVGFYGEELILDLVERGLGTCWVGGTFDKSEFTADEGCTIACVITVGYPDSFRLKDKVMYSVLHKRKSAEERITSDSALPENVGRGVEAVITAPSAVNSQKPHFSLSDGVLTVSVPDTSGMTLIDLGIAKYHFFDETGLRFEYGNDAKIKI